MSNLYRVRFFTPNQYTGAKPVLLRRNEVLRGTLGSVIQCVGQLNLSITRAMINDVLS